MFFLCASERERERDEETGDCGGGSSGGCEPVTSLVATGKGKTECTTQKKHMQNDDRCKLTPTDEDRELTRNSSFRSSIKGACGLARPVYAGTRSRLRLPTNDANRKLFRWFPPRLNKNKNTTAQLHSSHTHTHPLTRTLDTRQQACQCWCSWGLFVYLGRAYTHMRCGPRNTETPNLSSCRGCRYGRSRRPATPRRPPTRPPRRRPACTTCRTWSSSCARRWRCPTSRSAGTSPRAGGSS